MAPSRFPSLRFTSVGVFPDLIRILFRNSSRTVTFSYSAPALPCHRCIRFLHNYGLKILPFARPFLDKSTESSFFYSSSDLRIFKLDGFLWDVIYLIILGHPHSHLPSLLTLVPFAQSTGTCPLYRHTVRALSL